MNRLLIVSGRLVKDRFIMLRSQFRLKIHHRNQMEVKKERELVYITAKTKKEG